jgi:hypothetical protein
MTGHSFALEMNEYTLFSDKLRISIPANWSQQSWEFEEYASEEFVDEALVAKIAFAVEHKPEMDFSQYITYRKDLVEKKWIRRTLASSFTGEEAWRIIDYWSLFGKWRKSLILLHGETTYLTITVIMKRVSAKRAVPIIQQILDSIEYE